MIAAAALLLIGFVITSGADDDDADATATPVSSTVASTIPAANTSTSPAPGEIFLEPRDQPGPEPFTPSVAVPPDSPIPDGPVAAATPTPLDTIVPPEEPGQVQAVSGATPGLYGGTRDRTTCDPEQLVDFLDANPAKASAWAAAQQILPSDIRSYVATLTPVLLRDDTRVTNFGFDGTGAPARQVVLEAGTAVLVDQYGTPRVRCFCGNPLSPPTPQDTPTYTGQPWPAFDPAVIVVISPAPQAIDTIVIIDVWNGEPFERPIGSTGDADTDSDDPFLVPSTTVVPPPDTEPPVSSDPPVSTDPPVGGARYEGGLDRIEADGTVEPPPAGASTDDFVFVDGDTIDVAGRFTLPASTDDIVCLDFDLVTQPGDVVIDRTTGALSGSTTLRIDFTMCGGGVADYPASVAGQIDDEQIEFRLTFTAEGGTGTLVWTGTRVG